MFDLVTSRAESTEREAKETEANSSHPDHSFSTNKLIGYFNF